MNKYEEDILDAIEYLGYDTSRLSNDELAIINNELQDMLVNDDLYNTIYIKALQDVLAAHNIEQL